MRREREGELESEGVEIKSRRQKERVTVREGKTNLI